MIVSGTICAGDLDPQIPRKVDVRPLPCGLAVLADKGFEDGGDLLLLLADKLGIKRELIDYYERRSPNPALDFIERAAAALEVSVAELLGSQPNASRSKPGPQSQLQRKFEQVKLLPRKKQKFILQFLDTVLESNQQKS